MNQSEYLKIVKLAKTALNEYKNWGEDEIVTEQLVQPKKQEPALKPAKNIKQDKNAEQLLEELKKQIVNCQKCGLGATRLNAVFGSGSAYADIMFVGEGPGFQEDHKGQPFIGRAGDLLTKIIEAMHYTRETVYIANIVKCHPMKDSSNPELRSNDRPPTPQEMAACHPYLDEQIRIINPKVIITLGASSTRALLKTEDLMGNLRGKFQEYNGIKLMPTYHPAALLRNPNLKKDVWQDMKKVMAYIGKKA